MSEQTSAESETARAARFRHRLDAEIPTIKILFYADDPDDVHQSSSPDEFLGLGLMLARLRAHEPASARLSIQYACRYESGNPEIINKLDKVLEKEHKTTGEPFDQIWFFGLHQTNVSEPSVIIFDGGPENELDANEVSALWLWMQANQAKGSPGGGVLMTGDHSNGRPIKATLGTNPLCPDPSGGAALLGLGRALGRCVPRAGQLRVWEGSPTKGSDSLNTVENPGTEDDDKPQRLFLRNVNELGDPDPQGQPHPLFHYAPGQFIEVFPDHPHEGALRMPQTFDPNIWPPGLQGGAQPLPHVVAHGINQRTSERIDLIAAYHGDRAGVGRIVVDSTWHHYFNRNLRGLPHPAPKGSDSDRIGQFYANLAVWLTPRVKLREMARAMLWKLAKYTLRLEYAPDDPEPELSIGQAAYSALSQVASPCEIHELIYALAPERYQALNFPEGGLVLSHLPSRGLLLGAIMCSYHDEMLRAERGDNSYQPIRINQVIDGGFERAFKKQIEKLGQKAADALKFLGQKPS